MGHLPQTPEVSAGLLTCELGQVSPLPVARPPQPLSAPKAPCPLYPVSRTLPRHGGVRERPGIPARSLLPQPTTAGWRRRCRRGRHSMRLASSSETWRCMGKFGGRIYLHVRDESGRRLTQNTETVLLSNIDRNIISDVSVEKAPQTCMLKLQIVRPTAGRKQAANQCGRRRCCCLPAAADRPTVLSINYSITLCDTLKS